MNSKRRIIALTDKCIDCLKFLKSNSFNPRGLIAFEGFSSKVRALKFNVLLKKMMNVPGCLLGENVSSSFAERGNHCVRLRQKRTSNTDSQGFELAKLLHDIKVTNAVPINSMLFRHDYKSPPKKDGEEAEESKDPKQRKERKLQGLLTYVDFPTAKASEQFLQILFAWGETKAVRNLVFQHYPGLQELQADDLTDAEDQIRSEERQQLIRKAGSRTEDDEATRRELCEVKLTQNERWSSKNLADQKKMYHFDFALAKKEKPTSTKPSSARTIAFETEA